MGVKGDGLCYRPGDSFSDTDPYTGTDYRLPSATSDTGWRAPDVVDDAGARHAVRELANRLALATRHCPVCHSDLADVGTKRSNPPEGFKASTGVEKDTAPSPQGGHNVDCQVPYILLWLDGKPSIYTRVRA